MKLIKHYDCVIDYHLGKANVVANPFSRKSSNSLGHIRTVEKLLPDELRSLPLEVRIDENNLLVAHLKIKPIHIDSVDTIFCSINFKRRK